MPVGCGGGKHGPGGWVEGRTLLLPGGGGGGIPGGTFLTPLA